MNRIMMVLAVLLVCLLAISAVSAETDAAGTDGSTDGVESTDEAILGSSETDELQNDNELASVDTDSGKLEMGEGEVLGKDINVTGDSFTDIENAIASANDGDTIFLQGGNFTGNGQQIIIDKELTIIGGFEKGDGIYATLDAQKMSRIFQIDKPVTIQGIKFINGNCTNYIYSADSNGGAIYVYENCRLIDCIFTNNHAANYGGAIYVYGGCILIDCIFTNNHAHNGGAIYWYTNAVGIANCTFENNSADIDGGANYFDYTLTNVTLTGNFINNSAKYYGGANFFSTVTNVTLSGNFISNSAGSGGANYFDSLYVVTNVKLTGNFISNSAGEDGGANFFSTVTNVTLSGNFINNSAGYGGGANYFNGGMAYSVLTGNFINNSAGSGGGANYFNGGMAYSVLTGNFINNSAKAKYGQGGANCFMLPVSHSVLTCNFTNNSAGYGGGANYFDVMAYSVLTCNFINNSAGSGGGANYFRYNVDHANLTGNFTNNNATRGGANYFYQALTNVNLTATFTDNHANYSGGANYFISTVTKCNFICNFSSNSAGIDGGANYFSDGMFDSVLTCNFINNSAGREGGANYFDSLYVVTNVTFTGNYIGNTGKSVIYIAKSLSDNVIRDSIFINNAPIKVDKGNVTAVDTWFGNNVTDYDVAPDVGIALDNWLFLNATADLNPVLAAKSDIIFMLWRYDETGVSSYDNSRLHPVSLDVTSAGGSVNTNQTGLNESIAYMPEIIGTGSVTASLENVVCTIEIENLRVNPKLKAYFEGNITYGEDALLMIEINTSAAGLIEVYNVDAEPVLIIKIPVDAALDGFRISGLNSGIHSFNIKYTGDESFAESSCNASVTVREYAEMEMEIPSEVELGDAAVVNISLPEDATGIVTVFVNDAEVGAAELKNGNANISIAGLDLGNYNVTAIYQGDSKYLGSNRTGSFKVSKLHNYVIKVTMIDALKLTAVLTDEAGNPVANAAVSYTLDDGEAVNETTNDNGEFVCNVKSDCVLTMSYVKGNFILSTASITLKNIVPSKKSTQIIVPSTMTKTAVDYNAGEKGTMFYFYLKDGDGNPVPNKGIKIGIFDKIYTVKTDSNGRGGLQINIANANYYTYAISFLGNDDYKASFAVCSLKIVKKSVTITPAKTSYSFKANAKTKTVTATLKSTNSYIPKGKPVTLTIAGKTFKATVGAKGQISFNIGSITKKGTYKVAVKFAGTNTYAAANSKTITIKIA